MPHHVVYSSYAIFRHFATLTKIEPGGSASLVLGSACCPPAVQFWFAVQENILQNWTKLNFLICTCGSEKYPDTSFLIECQLNHIRQIVDMN